MYREKVFCLGMLTLLSVLSVFVTTWAFETSVFVTVVFADWPWQKDLSKIINCDNCLSYIKQGLCFWLWNWRLCCRWYFGHTLFGFTFSVAIFLDCPLALFFTLNVGPLPASIDSILPRAEFVGDTRELRDFLPLCTGPCLIFDFLVFVFD